MNVPVLIRYHFYSNISFRVTFKADVPHNQSGIVNRLKKWAVVITQKSV